MRLIKIEEEIIIFISKSYFELINQDPNKKLYIK